MCVCVCVCGPCCSSGEARVQAHLPYQNLFSPLCLLGNSEGARDASVTQRTENDLGFGKSLGATVNVGPHR